MMTGDHARSAQEFSDSITTMPLDEALELRSTMQQVIQWTNDAVDIVVGFCSAYGKITLIFPPIGDPIIIPASLADEG